MVASGNLQGHGRPSVFLQGYIGQKYEDIDSGLIYVCKGERGFIRVDGDDQSEMYNWELIESGGSTGGGSTGGGVFTVDVTRNDDGSYSSDKTLDEIREAYNNGMFVQALCQGCILYPTYISTPTTVFNGWIIESDLGVSYTVVIKNNGETTLMRQFVALTSTPTT